MTAITHDHTRPGSRLPTLSLVVASAAAGLSIATLVIVATDDDPAVLPRQDAVAAEAPAAVAAPRDSATMIREAIDEALAEAPAAVAAPRDSATMIRAAIDEALAEKASAAVQVERDSATMIREAINEALAERGP